MACEFDFSDYLRDCGGPNVRLLIEHEDGRQQWVTGEQFANEYETILDEEDEWLDIVDYEGVPDEIMERVDPADGLWLPDECTAVVRDYADDDARTGKMKIWDDGYCGIDAVTGMRYLFGKDIDAMLDAHSTGIVPAGTVIMELS